MRKRLAAAALASIVAILATAAPASAHDELISSTPSANETLSVAPTEITLEFSEPLLEVGNEVVVVDGSGTDWVAGSAVLQGSILTIPLKSGLPNGALEVRWRVVSSDGHPIEGTLPFSLAVPGAESPAPSEEATAEVTEEELVAIEDTPIALAAQSGPAGADSTWLFVVGGFGLLALIAGLVIVRQRTRAAAETGDGSDD